MVINRKMNFARERLKRNDENRKRFGGAKRRRDMYTERVLPTKILFSQSPTWLPYVQMHEKDPPKLSALKTVKVAGCKSTVIRCSF